MARHVRWRLWRFAAVALLGIAVSAGAQVFALGSTAFAATPAACQLPDPSGVDIEDEAPTDYTRWLPPTGVIKGVVLFVDYSDAVGPASEISTLASVMRPAPDLYTTSSYGRLTLKLTFTAAWRRMPEPSSAYANYRNDFFGQQKLIRDAVGIYDPSVDFSPYKLVYVVPPSTADAFPISPAFIASPGDGVTADGVELRHGATIGQDMTTFGPGTAGWGFKMINHETSHTFGLPDLYTYGQLPPRTFESIGGWDMMGNIAGPAPDYLAWHKWKMGWLDDTQISCRTTSGRFSGTLTPLAAKGGTKAVVVHVGGQGRAVVVENRRPSTIDQSSNSCFKPGVLVYVVDATVAGGNHPIRIVDGHPNLALAGCSADHAELDNATLRTGEQIVEPASGIRVKVISSRGDNRTVQVTIP